MPCITAIQKNCIRAIGTNGFDHCRDPVQPAHAAIALRQRSKITRTQGVMAWAAIRDPVEAAKVSAGNMRHGTFVAANTQIEGRLSKVDRFELSMDVRDVNQRDVSEHLELQKLVLGQ